MTFLVDHQLTFDALESLSSQAPDTVMTKSTESLPVEPLGLKNVIIDLVHLPPPPGPLPVDVPVLHVTQLTRIRREAGKHVDSKLGILVHFVQTNSFIQLNLALNNTWIPLFIHPFNSQFIILGKPTNILHLRHQHGVSDLVINVGDEHLKL